jgi:hypothetical protein
MARSSSATKPLRKLSASRPRYWSFTPISRLTRSYGGAKDACVIAAASSSVVQPVVARMRGGSIARPCSRSRAASCIGQRAISGMPSPMV